MPANPTLSRSLACLSHPLSLAAILLLLLNDHLFRVRWPSWWTGKLGDFAWLFFFPFALAALLSLIIPKGLKRREFLVVVLAFALTGGVFALAKTWTAFHAELIDHTSRVLGWMVGWRLDPTDLIALFSLIASACLWRRVIVRPNNRPEHAWLLLCVASFLTLANSPAPEQGIICLQTVDDRVYAFSTFHTYRAEPSGSEWQEAGAESVELNLRRGCHASFFSSPREHWILPHPTDPNIQYRLASEEPIERSSDGGQTWAVDLHLRPESEAMSAYYLLRNNGHADYSPGPLDAVFDPQSGNLILAMGHSGVLVRYEDGSYNYVPVGIHQHVEPSTSQVFFTLLQGESLMAALLGGLVVMFLLLRRRKFSLRHVLACISALGWIFIALLLPPALTYYYGQLIVMLVLFVAAILLLPLTIEAFIHAGIQSRRLFSRYLLIFGVSIILFLLPFLAWGVNVIPNYRLAQLFAVAFVAAWVYWQYHAIKQMPDIIPQ
jgi:hypothetical protein